MLAAALIMKPPQARPEPEPRRDSFAGEAA